MTLVSKHQNFTLTILEDTGLIATANRTVHTGGLAQTPLPVALS